MLAHYCCTETNITVNDDSVVISALLALLAAFDGACWQSWQVPIDGAWIGTNSAKPNLQDSYVCEATRTPIAETAEVPLGTSCPGPDEVVSGCFANICCFQSRTQTVSSEPGQPAHKQNRIRTTVQLSCQQP
jgi:hypothetical protein